MDYYDLNGRYYLNKAFTHPAGLPCYTDDILDSLLSAQRLGSLVRWQRVGSNFRPIRVTGSDQWLELTYGTQPLYPEDGWLWTAASDGTITIGWIMRDYDFASEPWSYEPASLVTPPYLLVGGLVEGTYEAIWFDDRRGTIIGRVDPFYTDGVFVQPLPNTDPPENPTGFGKSIAFLIQPVGYTPQRSFAALPNEPIGQITIEDLEATTDWHEERPKIHDFPSKYTFRVRTRPAITDPSQFVAQWDFGPDGSAGGSQTAEGFVVSNVSFSSTGDKKVVVDITDLEGKWISGDIIHVQVSQ